MPKGIFKNPESTKRRGFASMTPERRREISSMGGKATPPEKRPFAQNRALASAAGKAFRKDKKGQ